MKYLFFLVLLGFGFIILSSSSPQNSDVIGQGKQPQVSIDNKGIVRVVYGLDENIFCATSNNHGQTFSKPVLVAHITGMHLGMGRGPQLSSSVNYSVITAMDKTGNIHWFKLDHTAQKWEAMGLINDQKGSAPEGLMAISADKENHFYAVWLDTRLGGSNQIWFSSLSGNAKGWSANRLAYQSPDKHVCECCKPSIAVSGSTVAIMFRNWLNGSRDLYVAKSTNGGQTFSAAQKMGTDTWKLNGCPMDGGALRIAPSNSIQTVWQRKGDIYYAQPGKPEIYIAKGRYANIAGSTANAVVTYQNIDTLNMVSLPDKKATVIGIGSFLKVGQLTSKNEFFVWEQGNDIKFRTL